MQTNDHQIRDYDLVLDAEFGMPGTPALGFICPFSSFEIYDFVRLIFSAS